MQDIYNRKNYAMMLIVSVFIKILFTLKKTLRCNLMLVNIPAQKILFNLFLYEDISSEYQEHIILLLHAAIII